MKTSIIIPTYKRVEFLPDALSSAVAQDFPKTDYEILVVDNAPHPTPELETLCPSGSLPTIRYIHEPQNGLHNARHAGAKAAQGEILIYIDDDVICPPQWLAAMVAPYENPQVSMVAGKVNLRYEAEPPVWLEQFRGMLSELDLGDTPHPVKPYCSPVGCNMSVRKSVLFDVGGFNPDGFGNPALIYLRGDGECGLARKVHDAGKIVWYEPTAWLEHQVPLERVSEKYIKKRSSLAGIEQAYVILRYCNRSHPLLFASCFSMSARILYNILMAAIHRKNEQVAMKHRMREVLLVSRLKQTCHQIISRIVRNHTKKICYFN